MEFSPNWPMDSRHYINKWERVANEHPTLSHYGVEGHTTTLQDELAWAEVTK